MRSSSAFSRPLPTGRTECSAAAIATSTDGGLRVLPPGDAGFGAFRRLLEEQLTDALGPALADTGMTRNELLELPNTLGELRAVEADGEVAGYVWLELRRRTLHVHALLLLPQFRGRGLGARALHALEADFAGAADELELGVHEGNRLARALYDRCGFRVVERRPDIGFSIMRKRVIAENP